MRWLAIALVFIGPRLNAAPLPLELLGINQANVWADANFEQQIIIAVIDDGFAMHHPSFEGMLWNNPAEIAFNGIDDDNNGYVDDTSGWDIADMDEEFSPPASRLSDYDHGTYSAGLIAQIIHAKLGKRDDYPVKLMFIKAISDQAGELYVKHGYTGIDYAVKNGASVISNAWSGGFLNQGDSAVLNFARSEGVFIVNSVGNFPSREMSHPASHPGVLGVAGVNEFGEVIEKSNYGKEVDLVSVASDITGISLASKSRQQTHSGTSVAAPVVAATVALMKLANPGISHSEIRYCLANTAKPVDAQNPNISGKLGAGLVQIDAAIECAREPETSLTASDYQNAKGAFGFKQTSGQAVSNKKWRIRPIGENNSINLSNSISGEPQNAYLLIRGITANQISTVWSGPLKQLPRKFVITHQNAEIELQVPEGTPDFSWISHYAVIPVDQEKRFCSGKVIIDQETIISDGSGEELYASQSNCKWLIQARPGQAIRIEFTELDLDAETDKIYLFRDDTTAQTNMLATLTGNELPPGYIIKGGSALIWLLSDKLKEAQGFAARISWVDDKPE